MFGVVLMMVVIVSFLVGSLRWRLVMVSMSSVVVSVWVVMII